MAPDPLLLTLFDRRLLIVSGKGGVGRTTIAAVLARAAAGMGKRVLLAQMQGADTLARLLGLPAPVGPAPVRVSAALWAVNLTPRASLHEYGALALRSGALATALFDNRAVRGFLHAVPGLPAYAMLGHAWWHATRPPDDPRRLDLVVLDAPASGHILKTLTIPQAILSAMPRGPLAREAAAMLADFRDPARTALVVVALPEQLPAREAAALARSARDELRLPLGPLVVNGMPPAEAGDPALRALLAALPARDPDPERAAAAAVLRLYAARHRSAAEVVASLRADPGLPMLELPRLPTDELGPAEVEQLVARLIASPAAPPPGPPHSIVASS